MQSKENITITKFLHIAINNWFLIGLGVVGGFFIALAYLLLSPTHYKAEAKIRLALYTPLSDEIIKPIEPLVQLINRLNNSKVPRSISLACQIDNGGANFKKFKDKINFYSDHDIGSIVTLSIVMRDSGSAKNCINSLIEFIIQDQQVLSKRYSDLFFRKYENLAKNKKQCIETSSINTFYCSQIILQQNKYFDLIDSIKFGKAVLDEGSVLIEKVEAKGEKIILFLGSLIGFLSIFFLILNRDSSNIFKDLS
jgi:hypothetical protein